MPFPATRPDSPSSKYKLKRNKPTGFTEEGKKKILLHLRHRIVGRNLDQYEFDYRTGWALFDASGQLENDVSNKEWIPFFSGTESSSSNQRADDEQFERLDIHIYQRDAVVEMVTFGELFWSREQHAIQTKISREDFYGYLRYTYDGANWLYFDDYMNNEELCRRVIFKAKVNPDFGNRNHKFSFFVKLKKANDDLLEYEIDPDIKNPSS